MVDICYNFVKFHYEDGNYSGSNDDLCFHQSLMQITAQSYLQGM